MDQGPPAPPERTFRCSFPPGSPNASAAMSFYDTVDRRLAMRHAAAMSSPEPAEPISSDTLSDIEEEVTLRESSDSGSGGGAAAELTESE